MIVTDRVAPDGSYPSLRHRRRGMTVQAVRAAIYREHLRTEANLEAMARRKPVDHARYRELHERSFPADGGDHPTPQQTTGPFRLAGISGHKRVYQAR